MEYITGQTIYELIVSVDENNTPQSAATFSTSFFKNGSTISIVPIVTLIDDENAIFSFSWSASTDGYYQYHLLNNVTNVIYVSDRFEIVNSVSSGGSSSGTTIYVGL